MAPKNDCSKDSQVKAGGSKSSANTKTGSGSTTQSVGPLTQSKAKVMAQANAKAMPVPKSTLTVGTDLQKSSSTPSKSYGGKEVVTILKGKEDDDPLDRKSTRLNSSH